MALAGAALGMILPRRGNRPAPAAAGAPEPGRLVRAAGVPGDLAPGDLARGDLARGDLAPGDVAGTAGHARGATR